MGLGRGRVKGATRGDWAGAQSGAGRGTRVWAGAGRVAWAAGGRERELGLARVLPRGERVRGRRVGPVWVVCWVGFLVLGCVAFGLLSFFLSRF